MPLVQPPAAQTDLIVSSGMSAEDRQSLMALQTALGERGPFRYLEVGCYHGATLQSFVADPACEAMTAIDRRDAASSDARTPLPYPENTSTRMLELLGQVPGADLTK